MKNKKGFTLVELMAVVIVLIIIVFIAINKVNKSTKDAREKTIVANAGLYMKAANGIISEKSINDDDYESGLLTTTQLDALGLTISGTKPDSGFVIFSNSEVTYACFVFGGYNIVYNDGNYLDVDKANCTDIPMTNDFDFKNKQEVFTVPVSGEYKLEVWGAQGGSYSTIGGYGAYSTGTIYLKSGDKLYINVGGTSTSTSGGYNGGGVAGSNYNARGGGGATSIATKSGLLSTLSGNVDKVLIVAGGGGGSDKYNGGSNGGAAGGISGMPGGYYRYNGSASFTVATGGTQTEGGHGASGAGSGTDGTFGLGGSQYNNHGGGGGGGYYGGGGGSYNDAIVGSGAGGSSYIGNSKLSEKSMYCYNCTTSNIESTNTISVNCAENDPTPKCAKKENGYAKISLVINDLSFVGTILDEYQQVSYIESSGSQYIDIDYKPKTNTKVVFDLSFSGEFKPYQTYGGSPEFFGVSETDGTKAFYINFGEESNQGNQLYIWNDREYGINSVPVQSLDITNDIRTNRNLLTLENGKVTYGSISQNIINKENNNISSMYVFGANSLFDTNYAGAFNSYNMRLYNLKIYEGSNLVHDYRPCYKGSNIGLCDVTTNKFYGNSGTGTFIKGNDI